MTKARVDQPGAPFARSLAQSMQVYLAAGAPLVAPNTLATASKPMVGPWQFLRDWWGVQRVT